MAGRAVIRLGAIAAIAALGAWLSYSELSRNKMAAELQSTKADAAAALAAVIEPATVRRVEDSVYLVETPVSYGTAFVIDREKGLLATAAHLAEDIDMLDPSRESVIVNRFSGKPLRITAARAHSGYGRLSQLAEDYQPIDPEGLIYPPAVVPIYDAAFDAGILIVNPIDPVTGENILGPSLPIASMEALLALQTGDPIAVVSYPSDARGTDDSVASRAERGIVSATLAPIDFAGADDDPLYRTIIAHRMTTKSGSSGGPLVNGAGEVVGIFVAYGGSDSFACRADLLYDLLSPLAEEKSLAEIHAPEWRRRLSGWTRAKDALPYIFYRAFGVEPRPPNDELLGVRDYAATPYAARVDNLILGKPLESFAVPAPDLAPGAESAEAEGGVVAPLSIPTFTLPEKAQFAVQSLSFRTNNRTYVAFAFDYTLKNPRGSCSVGFYVRRLGGGPFMEIAPATVPFAILPSGDYEFVYYRPLDDDDEPCDDKSARFLAGVVSFRPPKPAATAETPSGLRTAAVAGLLEGTRHAVANFVNCNIARSDDCVEPVYASFDH